MKYRAHIFLLLISIVIAFIFFNTVSGDASIYFTFANNFFDLPFSYSQGKVSFGATSPLYTVYLAIIYSIGGSSWIAIAKILNLMIIYFGFVLILIQIPRDKHNPGLLVLLAVASINLYLTGLQLYETPLVFLSSALILSGIRQQNYGLLSWVSGMLYLIRPELALFSVLIWIYLAIKKQLLTNSLLILLSMIPAIAYHWYMYDMTGGVLPSSVVGRSLNAIEAGSYLERLLETIRWVLRPEGLIYLFYFFTVVIFAIKDIKKLFSLEKYFPGALLLLFILSPPGQYINRYLLPVTPFIIWHMIVLWQSLKINKRTLNIAGMAIAIAIFAGIFVIKDKITRFDSDYDELMLKGLAAKMNKITTPDDKLLIYEIQSQYFLEAQCISMDGIVGREFHNVLTGKENLKEFIEKEDVDYIVTMNSINYRKLLDIEELKDIYKHDLDAEVGDTLHTGETGFVKIMENPVFGNPLYYDVKRIDKYNIMGDVRVANINNRHWSGHHPFWNAVYKIIR